MTWNDPCDQRVTNLTKTGRWLSGTTWWPLRRLLVPGSRAAGSCTIRSRPHERAHDDAHRRSDVLLAQRALLQRWGRGAACRLAEGVGRGGAAGCPFLLPGAAGTSPRGE